MRYVYHGANLYEKYNTDLYEKTVDNYVCKLTGYAGPRATIYFTRISFFYIPTPSSDEGGIDWRGGRRLLSVRSKTGDVAQAVSKEEEFRSFQRHEEKKEDGGEPVQRYNRYKHPRCTLQYQQTPSHNFDRTEPPGIKNMSLSSSARQRLRKLLIRQRVFR